MSTISIRLPDPLLHEVELRAQALHVPRGEYIRRAIEYMNQETLRREREARLIAASALVRDESMIINSEFAQVENDPQA